MVKKRSTKANGRSQIVHDKNKLELFAYANTPTVQKLVDTAFQKNHSHMRIQKRFKFFKFKK